MSEITSGSKTSELKVLIFTILGLITPTIIGMIPVETMALYGTILSGLYIVSRTVVKITATKKDDEILELIDQYILPKISENYKKKEKQF